MSAKPLSPRAKVLLSRAGVLLFYLALWGVLARIVHQPLLLPAPGEVLTKLLSLLPSAAFYQSLGATLLRTLQAYALGIAAALFAASWGLSIRFYSKREL